MIKIIFFLILVFSSSVFANDKVDKDLIRYHDFLEVSKNYMETQIVHKKISKTERTLKQLNNLNFALKPRVAPIKPLDMLKIHYAYPIKIFLPDGTTVTSAKLSNGANKPIVSQNVIIVSVKKEFESGLLDIVYIKDDNIKNGNLISIKLDKYVVLGSKELNDNRLYTQVRYYESKKLDNNTILSYLKPFEYSFKHSQVKYMGKVYDIKLVSIVEDMVATKKYMDNKYINCSIFYKGKSYNYFIE